MSKDIKVVYIRSKKLYLPLKFPQEIFGINDTLRYFIKGEGYRKTRAYDILDITIPSSKDNIIDIADCYNKYKSKEICLEYLITNNAIFWKYDMLNSAITTPYDKLTELAELSKIFNCKPFTLFHNGLPNIISFETLLVRGYGYNCEESGLSMNSFIVSKFGVDLTLRLKKFWGLSLDN
jgi:hypothetical protein